MPREEGAGVSAGAAAVLLPVHTREQSGDGAEDVAVAVDGLTRCVLLRGGEREVLQNLTPPMHTCLSFVHGTSSLNRTSAVAAPLPIIFPIIFSPALSRGNTIHDPTSITAHQREGDGREALVCVC